MTNARSSQPPRLGIQQRVLTSYRAPLFDSLAQTWHGDVSVFAGDPRSEEQIATASALEHAQFTHAVNKKMFGGPLTLFRQPGLMPWLEEWDPDVLIASANPRFITTTKGIKWMRRRDRPIIGWGLGTMSLASGFESLRAAGRKRCINQFDALIAYSSRAKSEYARLGFDPGSIFVACNACTFRPTTPLPDRPATYDGKAKLLFVGRMVPGKRLDTLLRACAALPEEEQPELWLVGDGPERAPAEAVAHHVFPDAKFLGARFGDDLARTFDEADAFVLPGLGGLAIQQAMAHGLPVIVADGDGTQDDLVRDDLNGWNVPPGNEAELAKAIRSVTTDVTRMRAMGAESYRIVDEEINIESMVQTFIEAIESVL